MPARFNPAELEIALFCKGARIADSCTLESDARLFSRTRAGLGSGLELVIPGDLKALWLNVPVHESFVKGSPFLLVKSTGGYHIIDESTSHRYPVHIPPEPHWYQRSTSRGTPMAQIGVLQGTYLGIYINNTCSFWHDPQQLQCKFCTTGLNVGTAEKAHKSLADVVEVAQAAKAESGVTFVHFNSGYQDGRDLDLAAPYVAAIKEQVGALVGLQLTPHADHWRYDWLLDLGVDHLSFCYEFHNPAFFARYLPGKEAAFGQRRFFEALEYTASKMPRGAVSGEIIAGIEPLEDTLKAIDYITGIGAFPTVCIFRPTVGSQMEGYPSPDPAHMRIIFEHLHRACRKAGLPIGLAPNIEVSLVVQADDAAYLVPRDWRFHLYRAQLGLLRHLARPVFARRLRPQPVKADATNPAAYAPA